MKNTFSSPEIIYRKKRPRTCRSCTCLPVYCIALDLNLNSPDIEKLKKFQNALDVPAVQPKQ